MVGDDRDGAEKFSDARIAQAQSILVKTGPVTPESVVRFVVQG